MVNSRRKAYAVLFAVFVFGGIVGSGTTWALSQREMRRGFENRRLDALSRELDLTSEQRDRIREIFERHRSQRDQAMREMVDRCGEKLKAERERLRTEIHAVLTPEQRKRYDELVSEHGRSPFGPGKRRKD